MATQTLTFEYEYDEEEGPTPEDVRKAAEIAGVSLDRFMSQAVAAWTEARLEGAAEVETRPGGPMDPFGVTDKLKSWKESGQPGVVRRPPRD